MGRKIADVTIADEGRDKGKVFSLVEMSASAAEKWAGRALFVAAQSGADILNVRAGMAGVATLSIGTVLGAKFSEVEPLLDEMFECVAYRPDPRNPAIMRGGRYCNIPGVMTVIGPLVETDIEEVMTRVKLRQELLTLHLGFSIADALSNWMNRVSATQD